MLEARSAIETHLARGGRDGARGGRGLRIIERRGFTLTQLAVHRRSRDAGLAAVRAVLGLELPESVDTALTGSELRLYRTGPEQYWVVSTDPATPARLADALPAAQVAVTPLSSSRVCVSLCGPMAASVLATGIPVDLHPSVFPVGAFRQTGLHHTGVLLERRDSERYDLFFLRTFAATLHEWLTDAALGHGYELGTEAY
jgi:methylglutamate dehydrogenase subunit D